MKATLDKLRTAKSTAKTYNTVLGIAQGIIEKKAIEFTTAKAMSEKTIEEKVVCTLCDLLSLNIQRPASLRSTMAELVDKAERLVSYK